MIPKTILCVALPFAMNIAADAALVAHWNMNESSGNIADSSGNNLTGTASASGLLYGQGSVTAGTYGAITVDSTTAAAFGSSIDFTRASQGSFSVTNSSLLETLREPGPTGDFTVMAWVRTDALPSSTTYRVFGTGPTGGWGLGMANVDRIRFTAFGQADFTSTGTVATNAGWHHIALVVSGTTYSMYADGNSIGTGTTAGFTEETASLYMIGGNANGSDFFDGQIDELKIFNNALNQAEVQTQAITAVPEPAVAVLGCLGVLSLLRRRRA